MVKLKDVGESGAIKYIGRFLSRKDFKFSILKFNDDALAFRAYGKYIVLNIDGYSVRYSKYYWLSYYDLGWKASTMAISDVVVKGAKPAVVASSVGFRKTLPLKHLGEFVRGLRDSAKHHGAKYLGGDINEALDEWVSTLCLGFSKIKPIPRKSRITVGDIVVSYGEYGLTGAAIHAHYNNINIGSWKKIVYATRKPVVPIETLKFISKLGRKCIVSSIDSSDGLAKSLHELSKINKIGFIIDNIPIDPEASEYAKTYSLKPEDLALFGGEEFYPIFIIRKKCMKKLESALREFRKFKIIGKTIATPNVYLRKEGKFVEVKSRGWEYFKNKQSTNT